MRTNIENFLTIIEEINKTIDDLVVENDTWTGSTLSGTNRDIKGVEGNEEEKLKDEVKEKWGENFVGENDDTVYDILTEDEWIELVGENGENAIKNLSTEDIEKVVLLKGAPKVRGYILRSGKYAGKLVIKPLLKSAKLVKGLVAGKKLSTIANRKTNKSSGFCFCNELAEEHDDTTSNGDWKKIRRNIVDKITNSTYTKGEGKIILKTYDRCTKDLGSNVTDKSERISNASDCNVMKDALQDFDNIMQPILSQLGKYFRLKDQKNSKKIKGKSVGDTLGAAKLIKVKWENTRTISMAGGRLCTNCLSDNSGTLTAGNIVKVTPLGGQGDRTIKCSWNTQGSTVGWILMEFEHSKIGDTQTIKVKFFDSSGNKISETTSVSGKITSIENN
ncbi:hypothetical protein N9F18_01155 [bacterium]|nr:hypothetical protein [bacterium]